MKCKDVERVGGTLNPDVRSDSLPYESSISSSLRIFTQFATYETDRGWNMAEKAMAENIIYCLLHSGLVPVLVLVPPFPSLPEVTK